MTLRTKKNSPSDRATSNFKLTSTVCRARICGCRAIFHSLGCRNGCMHAERSKSYEAPEIFSIYEHGSNNSRTSSMHSSSYVGTDYRGTRLLNDGSAIKSSGRYGDASSWPAQSTASVEAFDR